MSGPTDPGSSGADPRRDAARYVAHRGDDGGAGGAPDDEPDAGPGASARPRMSVQNIETWVDQSIRQAEREGKFDDLPGTGKPLDSLTSQEKLNDPDWFVKGLAEREKLDLSGAMPVGMALRRERAGFPESLFHLRDEDAVRARLDDFNDRVIADRRKPYAGPGSPPVVGRVCVDELIEDWRAARAALDAAAADSASAEPEPAPSEAPARPRRRWFRRPSRE